LRRKGKALKVKDGEQVRKAPDQGPGSKSKRSVAKKKNLCHRIRKGRERRKPLLNPRGMYENLKKEKGREKGQKIKSKKLKSGGVVKKKTPAHLTEVKRGISSHDFGQEEKEPGGSRI